MKTIFSILLILICLINSKVNAQVEEIIIETYYISGSMDTASSDWVEPLKEGSVTYRIYADIEDSSKLIAIYGDNSHPLIITSTSEIFNNTDRGESFGYEIRYNKLDEYTLALDSWITLGYATNSHLGIVKENDPDGCIDEILNNENNMLSNVHPEMGITLDVADGLVPNIDNDLQFSNTGFFTYSDSLCNTISLDTSTVFGNVKGNEFISSCEARISSSSGIIGPTSDNIVLLAQITTKGTISFKLNLEIMDRDGKITKYVANDTDIEEGIKYSYWLKYPFEIPSGCTNPWFIEYNPKAIVDDGSCVDSVVLGCMDPKACNFNPNANKDIRELCCYGPDKCDNRDISLVCPEFAPESQQLVVETNPNPVSEILNLSIETNIYGSAMLQIFNAYGNLVLTGQLEVISTVEKTQLDFSHFESGLYLLLLSLENTHYSKYIIVQ